MGLKIYRPTSPGRRGMTAVTTEDLSKKRPEKSLTEFHLRTGGRNNEGRTTVRFRGGGHKRLYRRIDFRRDKVNVPARVAAIEYDPNRSARIALLHYADGEKRYILLPKGAKVGDTYITAENAEIKTGNRLPLKNITVGTFIYNVEVKPNGGAKLARSGGSYIELIAKDAGYVDLKMPSSEVRKVKDTAFATVGEVANDENRLVNLGKAGRSRWLGIRPTVRGTAQNPVDHPYGGGEGRQGRGRRRAVSVYGRPTGKGQKTRTPKKYSNKHIVSRRKVGKRK